MDVGLSFEEAMCLQGTLLRLERCISVSRKVPDAGAWYQRSCMRAWLGKCAVDVSDPCVGGVFVLS